MADRSIINGSKHARPRGSHQRGESTGLNIVINSSSVIIIMKDDESRRSPRNPRAFRLNDPSSYRSSLCKIYVPTRQNSYRLITTVDEMEEN